MPSVLVIRFLFGAMCCWLVFASAEAETSLRADRTAAPSSQSRNHHVYHMMTLAEITTALNPESDLLFEQIADQTAGQREVSLKDQEVSRFPGPLPSRVSNAAFHSDSDIPAPIVLVDCGEDAGWDMTSQCEPIFESTLSSHPEGGLSSIGWRERHELRSLRGARCDNDCQVCNPCSPWYKVFRSFCSEPTFDEGIGRERVMFAPFDIEVPLPNNHFAIRYDSADGLRTPDRAEYFWASQTGPGPDAGERVIDYQDLRFIMSAGGKRFSTITEVPLRFIDAPGNGGTGGLSNISIATKLLLIDGQHWKITQFFKTYLNTGSVARGLSNGHVSLEPGLLAQYKWSPTRYWFSELRYWFPTGADPDHGGNVLRYSLGTSKLWYETDTFAAIRTLEFVGTSVLSGMKTLPDGTDVVRVDGEHSMAILPGLRFVLGPAGDLGLFELGVQAGIATNKRGFYTSLSRVELRFNF